jgi:3-hydroxybutyryl-CoA dehydrogenase
VTAGVVRLGVVGCGTMGSGLAEVAADTGIDVLVAARTEDSAEAGRRRLHRAVDSTVRKGRRSAEDARALLDRVRFTLDLNDLNDRDLVVEAVREHPDDKYELFALLDKVVADDAVLASTTSSVPVLRLALATGRPDRVIGLHFFSPVPAMPLVEVIDSVFTGSAVHDRAAAFVRDQLGKQIIAAPDRAGFVVNTVLVPFLLAAVRLVESGRVDAETVDRGMVLGCGHPVGPLMLADLVGLDVVAQVADAMFEEFGEQQYAPPALLTRMVAAGLLGRKTGRGFHDHRPRQGRVA